MLVAAPKAEAGRRRDMNGSRDLINSGSRLHTRRRSPALRAAPELSMPEGIPGGIRRPPASPVDMSRGGLHESPQKAWRGFAVGAATLSPGRGGGGSCRLRRASFSHTHTHAQEAEHHAFPLSMQDEVGAAL